MSIIEVSKAAGVSIATVSRVMNGNPSVSPAKVKAVRAAMDQIGYTPPEEGGVGRPRRHPGGIRTGNVAVLFPDTNRNALRTVLSGRLLHGIEEALRRRSLSMVVTTLAETGEMPTCIERRQVDAVLVRGAGAISPELTRRIPAVWMLQSNTEVPSLGDMVLEDNAAIGAMAAKFLMDKGHRQLAFLNQVPAHPAFRVRRMFFQEEAVRAGAEVAVVSGEVAVAELVDRYLDSTRRATGLFVPGGDLQIVQIYQALEARGVVVGRDLDLISCNNDAHQLAALDPKLANIDIQAEAIGRAAVDLALWRLRHPKEQVRRVAIPPALHVAAGAPAAAT